MIKEFQGEYRWLSNFWPVNIKYNERNFTTLEHAFMSQKNLSKVWQDFCSQEPDAKVVSKLGKEIMLRPDWDSIKVDLMKELVELKFSQDDLKEKLVATKNMEIQEGNTWGDTFWGVDLETQKGENLLGKIIMDARNKLSR